MKIHSARASGVLSLCSATIPSSQPARTLAGILLLLATITALTPCHAAVNRGDIAIIGFNSDTSETEPVKYFTFVALCALPAGESISFTDNGWLATGGFRGGEGTETYQVPEGGLPAGTIVRVNQSGGTFNLSTSGDQITAYQVEGSVTTVLYAVNFNDSDWQVDAMDSNGSALPSMLVNGTTAIALPETDNAYFDTVLLSSGTAAEWLAMIGNPVNWISTNTGPLPLPSGALAVTHDSAVSDADGDGLPDEWESRFFAGTAAGTSDDNDDDGLTNLEEYVLDYDPTTPNDPFRVAIMQGMSEPGLTFPSTNTRAYTVECCDCLNDATNWSSLVTFTGSNGVSEVSAPTPTTCRFYRVKVSVPD